MIVCGRNALETELWTGAAQLLTLGREVAMRRRKLWWVLAGLAVLAVTLTSYWLFRSDPPSRATPQSAEQLQVGMTAAEVEDFLGPPGDYRTGPTTASGGPARLLRGPFEFLHLSRQGIDSHYRWETDDVELVIEMEPLPTRGPGRFPAPFHPRWPEVVRGDLRVAKVLGWDVARQDQSPLDNLLWRAKRQWRRWFPEK
jgi:hypothetical protein